MRYYRVKDEFDGTTAFKFARRGGLKIVGLYKGGELLTKTELKKRGDSLCINYLEEIRVQKNKVYWKNGKRFAA